MGRDIKSLQYSGPRKRKRSEAQREQLLAARSSTSSLPTPSTHAGNKENEIDTRLQREKDRGDGYQQSLYNERKKLKRSQRTNADQAEALAEIRLENGELRAEVNHLTDEVEHLEAAWDAESSRLLRKVESQRSARTDNSRKLHTAKAALARIPGRINTAVNKATEKARDELSQLFSVNLKEKGVVPDSTRDMINDLVALDGVRPNKVIGVLKRIAGKLGIRVNGDASDRTVRRIVKEGGVASQMQFVEAVGTSKGARYLQQ
ncbi:hypothetical protein B0H11DRAFT_1931443 [Mycena galericulata]|nr:hypothetical protein B0H11DRAFT_1931443 [Mycena galericulata]